MSCPHGWGRGGGHMDGMSLRAHVCMAKHLGPLIMASEVAFLNPLPIYKVIQDGRLSGVMLV